MDRVGGAQVDAKKLFGDALGVAGGDQRARFDATRSRLAAATAVGEGDDLVVTAGSGQQGQGGGIGPRAGAPGHRER
ncbi:hypothetical protein ACWGH2_44100 [Streptomyces sp. NPDC054871]